MKSKGEKQMLQGLAIFISGLALGAIIIFGLIYATGSQFIGGLNFPKTAPTPSQQIMPITTPQPTPTPTPIDQKAALQNLENQLYKEGFTISSVTVDQVFPGTGFIIKDVAGVRLFIHWVNTSVQIGQQVSVKGTLQKIADQQATLKQEPGYTAALDQFLKGQQILIQAQSVTFQQQAAPPATTP